MVNYDDVLSQLAAAGLIVDKPLELDGRIQRWRVEGEGREKRGWSRLREWVSKSGNAYIVGAYGVWHGADDGYTKVELPRREDGKAAIDREDIAAIREADKAAKKAVAEERKREAKVAAQWASAVWSHSSPCAEHDYLARKKVKSHGLRIFEKVHGLVLDGIDDSNWWRLTQAEGALVVPMHDVNGNVCGIQFIYGKGHPRRVKTERDKEFWPAGMAMGGTFGLIGPINRTGILLVAEGYATAATLHEATSQSVAYAFSANNLAKAGKLLRKAYPQLRLLFCADDDYLTPGNPGVTACVNATAEIERSAWIKPDFADEGGEDRRNGKKLTDFNDLFVDVLGALTLPLANQVNAKLGALEWREARSRGTSIIEGAGNGAAEDLNGNRPRARSIMSVDELVERFLPIDDGTGRLVFDTWTRKIVLRDQMISLLPAGARADDIKRHAVWLSRGGVYIDQVGFDPTEADPAICCNMFAGWPTVPVEGRCTKLLELLEYLCSNEDNEAEVYRWILKWLAYPLQHRGAKMHSAIVVHGPQGTGKSRFFEAYSKIFGTYGRVLGQEALEDKFNADWAEKKLFILADEVLARQDMFHIKNRLKGFITGDTIRVNPKNIAAHNEKNQMNIVFLSNERMPLVLENDDRRHLVIWVPPKLDDHFFNAIDEEIDAGGIAALHHYLIELDLEDFKPWTKPPMTKSKQDLIDLGSSSEERFIKEWMAGEIDGKDGEPLPFCPCLGSHLFKAYSRWCDAHGERKRGMKDIISLTGKLPGWKAGVSTPTWTNMNDRTTKNRKMVIPPETCVTYAKDIAREKYETKSQWLTACFFRFEQAVGTE